MLKQKNILKSKNKTYKVFTKYISADFLSDPSLPLSMKPSQYIIECWDRYKKNESATTYKCNRSLNGKIFEVIVVTAIYRSGVTPFYYQARAELVPDVDYDIIMYDKDHEIPITISVKTSTRERYKQADLEAYAFRNVHRNAMNYLVLLNHDDVISMQKKISAGMMLGLSAVIQANSENFDKFIESLKRVKLGKAPVIQLFDGQEIS